MSSQKLVKAMVRQANLLSRIAAVILILPALALAGPPFVTDDPEPVDLRHWEIYVATNFEHDPTGLSGTLPHLEVNYGAVKNMQLHLILPAAYARLSDGTRNFGYGDTEAGVKYKFVDQSTGRPSIGVFPLIEIPTGNEDRGLGSGHLQVLLPLWIQKDWNNWTTYGGGGYFFDTQDRSANYWIFGWEGQRNLGEHLTLGGELFAIEPDATDLRSSLNFNIGGQINVNYKNHILFSSGRSIKGDTDFLFYLAYQWTFGPK